MVCSYCGESALVGGVLQFAMISAMRALMLARMGTSSPNLSSCAGHQAAAIRRNSEFEMDSTPLLMRVADAEVIKA